MSGSTGLLELCFFYLIYRTVNLGKRHVNRLVSNDESCDFDVQGAALENYPILYLPNGMEFKQNFMYLFHVSVYVELYCFSTAATAVTDFTQQFLHTQKCCIENPPVCQYYILSLIHI